MTYYIGGNNFLKRKKLTINNNSGGALTNYQVNITVAYASSMQTDFDDIRFAYVDGTNVPYWLESKTDSTTASVWINVYLPNYGTSPTGDNIVYMYYGNSALGSGSNGADTFGNLWNIRDFTKYTETDPGSKMSVDSSSKVSIVTLFENTVTYLRIDLASAVITNFELNFDAFFDYIDTQQWGHGNMIALSLSDTNTNNSGYVGSNSTALRHDKQWGFLGLNLNNTNTDTGNWYDIYSLFADFQGYFTLTRVGSSVTLKIYSNSSRTSLLKTMTGTQGTAYRYISIWYANNAYNFYSSGNVENLKMRNYTTTDPTVTIGTEEHSRRNTIIIF